MDKRAPLPSNGVVLVTCGALLLLLFALFLYLAQRPYGPHSLTVPLRITVTWPLGKSTWTWTDASGYQRSQSDLDDLLQAHKLWLDSEMKQGTQAVFQRANLTGLILNGADLRSVWAENCVLSQARLDGTNLNGAFLGGSKFDGATLERADLTGASLQNASLVGTSLRNTRIDYSDLSGADMMGADLWQADLTGTTFEPATNPELRGIAAAQNLQLLRYESNPDALFHLRKLFEDSGFSEQGRKITFAIKKREAEQWKESCPYIYSPLRLTMGTLPVTGNWRSCATYVFNTVLFDWTCQYGMSPGRPLQLGAAVWLLCTFVYFVAIHASGRSGLFCIYEDALASSGHSEQRVARIQPYPVSKTSTWRRPFLLLEREIGIFGASMLFSLMSAFNIGFRDMNFGRWLRQLTREEFDIRPKGWVRAVSGWQSLVSVYLVALWVLTYFGRPFN